MPRRRSDASGICCTCRAPCGRETAQSPPPNRSVARGRASVRASGRRACPAPAPKAVASNANAPQVEAGISGEVVAAIAAAIAVSEGEGAVVKSIRKVNVVNVKGRNPWANAAVYDNTRPF